MVDDVFNWASNPLMFFSSWRYSGSDGWYAVEKEVIQLTPQRSFGLILCTIIVAGGAVHDACDATCKAMQTKRFGNMITNLSKETSGD